MLVVEDVASEHVLRRIVRHALPNAAVVGVNVGGGFGQIKARMGRYLNACNVFPHLVLTDLDTHRCATALMRDWGLPERLPERLIFRVAVREVEAWLMADRERIAEFLQVPLAKIPADIEAEIDPKRCLINLARRSRSKRFALEFCPAADSKASQGVLYNDHLIRFANEMWRVDVARNSAQSLDRALRRLEVWRQLN